MAILNRTHKVLVISLLFFFGISALAKEEFKNHFACLHSIGDEPSFIGSHIILETFDGKNKDLAESFIYNVDGAYPISIDTSKEPSISQSYQYGQDSYFLRKVKLPGETPIFLNYHSHKVNEGFREPSIPPNPDEYDSSYTKFSVEKPLPHTGEKLKTTQSSDLYLPLSLSAAVDAKPRYEIEKYLANRISLVVANKLENEITKYKSKKTDKSPPDKAKYLQSLESCKNIQSDLVKKAVAEAEDKIRQQKIPEPYFQLKKESNSQELKKTK